MLVFRIIYYAISLFCIGISVFLTYSGFLTTFGALTLPFTIVIGLGLLGADLLIQRYREHGQSIAMPMVLFLITAFFSITSNFNHLYTNFMRSTVMEQTIRAQVDLFRNDLTATRARLIGLDTVSGNREKWSQIKTELDNMEQQALDPNRPGCGSICQDHMRTINGLLLTPPTDLKVPPTNASPRDFGVFFDTYRDLVFTSFQNEPGNETFVAAETLDRYIQGELQRYRDIEELVQTKGLGVLEDLAQVSEDVERRANAIIPGEPIEHERIDPTLGRLGEIVYSLENAFIQLPNTSATVFATIAASIVDFFPIIFALIVFRSETPSDAPEIADEFI